MGGGRVVGRVVRTHVRTARSSDLETRTIRAHEIDQRQRTFERARAKPFRKHVSLVGRRLLVDQLMPIFVGKSLVNYADRDPLCPGEVPQRG